jgi:protocatechuate 3,4-dioxygenase beta subunit
VHLRETGQLAVTDDEGRFRFDRLRPGSYTVAARGPDGKEVRGKLEIPGLGVELTLGEAKAQRAAKSS